MSTENLKETVAFETSVTTTVYRSARPNIPNDLNLHTLTLFSLTVRLTTRAAYLRHKFVELMLYSIIGLINCRTQLSGG